MNDAAIFCCSSCCCLFQPTASYCSVRAPSPLAPENAKFLNFKRGEVRAPEHKIIFKKKKKKEIQIQIQKKERENMKKIQKKEKNIKEQ